MLYGGLTNQGGKATAVFEPGRYVLAGTASGDTLDISANSSLVDLNPYSDQPSTSMAGELFILTDANYHGGTNNMDPGVPGQWQNIPALNAANPVANLQFGSANIQGGNNTISLALHGLTPDSPKLTGGLDVFESGLFWQDQANSRVNYTSRGLVNYTAGPGCGVANPTIDNPCINTNMATSSAPGFSMQGSPNGKLYGVFYQPRGAWMTIQGGGNSTNYMRVMMISGALGLQGNASIELAQMANPPTYRRVVLVE